MKAPTDPDKPSLLLVIILVSLMTLLAGAAGVYVLSDPVIRSGQTLIRSASIIDRYYHHPVDWDSLGASAREAMIDQLDRFSGYVSREEFERIRSDQSGGYSGLGVTISAADSGLLVLDVRSGGPADAAGMLPGDVILQADSVDLRDISSHEASKYLMGQAGSVVRLLVRRAAAADNLTIEVTRGDIPFEHVPYAGYLADSVLYIRLVAFDPGASGAVAAALDSLLPEGHAARGLILDLRQNPGGLMHEALQTADQFLPEGTFIAGTNGRSRWNDVEFSAGEPDRSGGLPMIVLVDDGSASSSEIVAGALQQTGRARLIGDTTYGKGLVQGYVRFPGGDGLRLTISRYFLEGLVYLNEFDSVLIDSGRGLIPDSLWTAVDNRPFLAAVDRSLLIYQYAFAYQEDILGDVEGDTLSDKQLDRFIEFAEEHGFEYHSPIAQSLEELELIASWKSTSTTADRLLEQLRRLADRYHRRLFKNEANSAYLKRQIYAQALKRNSSTYRAYRDVLVPGDPEINLARRILTQRP